MNHNRPRRGGGGGGKPVDEKLPPVKWIKVPDTLFLNVWYDCGNDIIEYTVLYHGY